MVGVQIALFERQEALGGLLLIVAAAAAMLLANSPLAPGYAAVLHQAVGPLSVELWVNDALMAIFFLGVGLEVKRELVEGALSTPQARVLPVIAAAAGMIVPAGLYLLVAAGSPGAARGWAIPAATDIAFAQAVLAFAGRKVAPSLALFLTTVAIVDDIGAIAIIAIGYTSHLNLAMLGVAALLVASLWMLNRCRVMRLAPYLLVGGLLWVAVFLSGIHATVAGVVTALFIPLRSGGDCPLHRLEHRVHPWSAYLIVPLFGLANAGLSLGSLTWGDVVAPVTIGTALGLFLGKQIGVGLGTTLAIRSGLAKAPEGSSAVQLYGVALLAGIGFTMSLFIGGLAFTDAARFAEVKLGVLAGSLLSALTGFLVLRFAPLPRTPAPR